MSRAPRASHLRAAHPMRMYIETREERKCMSLCCEFDYKSAAAAATAAHIRVTCGFETRRQPLRLA